MDKILIIGMSYEGITDNLIKLLALEAMRPKVVQFYEPKKVEEEKGIEINIRSIMEEPSFPYDPELSRIVRMVEEKPYLFPEFKQSSVPNFKKGNRNILSNKNGRNYVNSRLYRRKV